MKPPARRPLLADRFLYTSIKEPSLRPGVLEAVRGKLRKARRFVLDDEATLRFAETIRDVPDLIIREQRFARAPFDTCWFEFPFPGFYEIVAGRTTDQDGDLQIGYLVDHGTAYVVAGGSVEDPKSRPLLLPLAYDLHEPWTLEGQIAFCDHVKTSRMQLDGLLWGETVLKLNYEDSRTLRDAHSCHLLTNDNVSAAKVFSSAVQGSCGDLRNIVALLLMMNRPSLTTYGSEIGRGRHIYRGKDRVFMSYSVVSIRLNPIPTLRLVGTPDGEIIPRRRHEVRGHYCHNEATRKGTLGGCAHSWERDTSYPEDDDNHWICTGCGGSRWWRTTHARGDSTIGYNAKHYAVTAEAEDG